MFLRQYEIDDTQLNEWNIGCDFANENPQTIEFK